jgi:hypothetical protein
MGGRGVYPVQPTTHDLNVTDTAKAWLQPKGWQMERGTEAAEAPGEVNEGSAMQPHRFGVCTKRASAALHLPDLKSAR